MQPATDCKPGHAEGDTALCQKSVLPDSRTGLKHQTDTGLKCPAASQECLLAAVFIRRCGQSVAAAVGESHQNSLFSLPPLNNFPPHPPPAQNPHGISITDRKNYARHFSYRNRERSLLQ